MRVALAYQSIESLARMVVWVDFEMAGSATSAISPHRVENSYNWSIHLSILKYAIFKMPMN
jgi:hypothetical protein